nr:transposon TX1 [Tanacetum cinerariifolium]
MIDHYVAFPSFCHCRGVTKGNQGIQGNGGIINIDDKNVNLEMINISVAGGVKSIWFLHKLPMLCEEQGLNKIEVKLLGGLEVMMVMKNAEMAKNVLEDKEHGLRRWFHKLRKGSTINRTGGKRTWINIMGIPISCWNEDTFKKIAAIHGTILAMSNCRLEGNQSISCGRVHIHTYNKGLIKDELNIKVQRKLHRISVVEEVRDISKVDIQESSNSRQACNLEKEEVEMTDKNDIQIDDERGDDKGESNNKGEDSSEDEEEGSEIKKNESDVGPKEDERSKNDSGRRLNEEDEGSRFFSEVKVGQTFEDDVYLSRNKRSSETKEAHRECNINECNEVVNQRFATGWLAEKR